MADERGRVIETELIVGMEVHVELSTRTKMFSRAGNPAHEQFDGVDANTLIDPVVLGLPGALPVMNLCAVELAMRVGMALGCSIAPVSVWDRKCYTYPDLPKGYQISQYALPLCFDGAVDVIAENERGDWDLDGGTRRVGIERAHLEEDAGKLLHEAPGGARLDFSIIDLNRAGTPLLEIVTRPDFRSADEAVGFARQLRLACRALGASACVMEKGQIRFEPNINLKLTLDDGRVVRTPIVEVKNLNSFRALRGAIEYEAREQVARWQADGREHGPGAKTTRGWDDVRSITLVQREKEDAHDYRYFPDPDLVQVRVDEAWTSRIGSTLIELPAATYRRFVRDLGLSSKEAQVLIEDSEACAYFERAVGDAIDGGLGAPQAARAVANIVLQVGARLAGERGCGLSRLGPTPGQVAELVALRAEGAISAQSASALFEQVALGTDADSMHDLAQRSGMLIVRDDAALEGWIDEVLRQQPDTVAQVQSGNMKAIGRIIGEVMKRSGGTADASRVREEVLKRIGVEP